MRFIHIGDVHLGMIPDKGSRFSQFGEKSIMTSFHNVIKDCNEKKVDLLLIAGDLFHKQPLTRQLKEINYLCSTLEHTQVVIIAGNHDFIGHTSYYKDFVWNANVTMFLHEQVESIYLEHIQTEVYGLSYERNIIHEDYYSSINNLNSDRINILLAHGGDQEHIPFDKNQIKKLGYDYVALGHIHKHEFLGDRIGYSGSLEPLDRTETGEHGYIFGDLTKDRLKLSFIPSAIREYKNIICNIESAESNMEVVQLIKREMNKQVTSKELIYTVTLVGKRDIDLIIDINTLKDIDNIIEIKDETVVEYDLEFLYRENKDNVIGMYINKGRELSTDKKIAEKAFNYGLQALLLAKE